MRLLCGAVGSGRVQRASREVAERPPVSAAELLRGAVGSRRVQCEHAERPVRRCRYRQAALWACNWWARTADEDIVNLFDQSHHQS